MLSKNLSLLIEKLEKNQPTKPSEVVKIINSIDLTENDLLPYSDYKHSTRDSYGRRLVYEGDNYEVMVMSWKQGDFSAIHDHGFAQWGAVKILGEAEHATFRWEDEHLKTLARWKVNYGDVVGVGHSLVHQMGNKDCSPFLSLHVYGHTRAMDNITGEARIFDPVDQQIQRVNGGAFLNLSEKEIVKLENGPAGDFPTNLRFLVELYRRKATSGDIDANNIYADIFSKNQKNILVKYLEEIIEFENRKTTNSIQWKILKKELIEAAELQQIVEKNDNNEDKFHKYAEVYDQVIGHTSLNSFMENYIEFFLEKYHVKLEDNFTLSIGCGTGLVESKIIEKYGLRKEMIYGMDLSASMISEAKKRINADVGDLMELDPAIRKWDIAYSGLNVFQYLPYQSLENAIRKTSEILNEGGYFLGDFITPDHIRWYPNVMFSSDQSVISLRTPQLVEENGASFQESEIINISFLYDKMEVHYAGKHKRFLPPIYRVRNYFEKYFTKVDLFDAVTLEPVHEYDDSCKSTRYIVVARK